MPPDQFSAVVNYVGSAHFAVYNDYPSEAALGISRPTARHRASRGQGLIEYALIILFVAIAVVAGLTLLGPTISSIFSLLPPAL